MDLFANLFTDELLLYIYADKSMPWIPDYNYCPPGVSRVGLKISLKKK